MQTDERTEPGGAERLLVRLGAARWWLPALEIAAWVVFFMFATVFLTLRYWVLPHIGRYRAEIVAVASRAVGAPVKIGAINAEWQGLRPHVQLSDVRVFDREGRIALVLPTVDSVVSWRSLLSLNLSLYSLTIEAPRLVVRRDASGIISVAGIRLGVARGGGGLAEWLLGQSEIQIRDGQVTWTDAERGTPPLTITGVNLRVRNHGTRHALGFTASLPQGLGTTIDFRAQVSANASKPLTAWHGEVYAALGSTDLAGWRRWVSTPVDLRQGHGAVRLWAKFGGGRLEHVTADVALAGVVAQLGKGLPALDLASVRGRVNGGVFGRGFEFGVRHLVLEAAKGSPMRGTSFRLRWEPFAAGVAGAPEHGSLRAKRLELVPLARLAGSLPLPDHLRRVLGQLAPQGRLLDVKFAWTGGLPVARTFTAQARFVGLGIEPWRDVPGFTGLSGSFNVSKRGGTLYLDARGAQVELPKIFPEPRIRLDTLAGEVDWRRGPGAQVRVRIANLHLANEHLAGDAYGTYVYFGQGPGDIDLTARFTRADGRYTAKYLPRPGIMGAQVRAWLTHAVISGNASDIHLRLKGDLRRFPFVDPRQGQFRITAHVNNGVLEIGHGWPRISDIGADLAFARDHMRIVASGAKVFGTRIANVQASIADLSGPRHELKVTGEAEGPTSQFLRFVRESPVRRMTHGVTESMSASGLAHLSLTLDLPLEDLAHSRVSGDLRLSDDALRVRPWLPPLEHLYGHVAFTESNLELRDLKAQLLGEPVTISGGTRRGGALAITARGEVSVAGLRGVFGQSWWSYLSGSTPYIGRITQRNGATVISIEAPLTGIASQLPPPLDKAARTPLRLHVSFLPGASNARERITVALGSVLRAELFRVRKSGRMVSQRTAVALFPRPGAAIRLPKRPGTLVYGKLPKLDLDRWLPLFRLGGTAAGVTVIDLRLGELDAFGKAVHDISLQAGTDAKGWTARVDARELDGELAYRYAAGGKLIARLTHFQIPQNAPGAAPGGGLKDLPSVDLSADSFTFHGKHLGHVEIVAQREGYKWRVDRLRMTDPEATLEGRGVWHTHPSETAFEFKLDAKDIGAFLGRIGYPGLVKGGSATLSGSASWHGDPLVLDYPTLSGKLELNARNGQFLQVNPGVGKLFSLMSLQMLPRRMTLDFRDVFSKGFEFNSISSSLKLENGIMRTNDLKMSGSAADVDMSGSVDLAHETQNLRVRVVPSIGNSASTVLSLINPIAGVSSFIAQRLLQNPLGQMFAYQYAITGSWSHPKVKKLEQVPVLPQAEPSGGTF